MQGRVYVMSAPSLLPGGHGRNSGGHVEAVDFAPREVTDCDAGTPGPDASAVYAMGNYPVVVHAAVEEHHSLGAYAHRLRGVLTSAASTHPPHAFSCKATLLAGSFMLPPPQQPAVDVSLPDSSIEQRELWLASLRRHHAALDGEGVPVRVRVTLRGPGLSSCARGVFVDGRQLRADVDAVGGDESMGVAALSFMLELRLRCSGATLSANEVIELKSCFGPCVGPPHVVITWRPDFQAPTPMERKALISLLHLINVAATSGLLASAPLEASSGLARATTVAQEVAGGIPMELRDARGQPLPPMLGFGANFRRSLASLVQGTGGAVAGVTAGLKLTKIAVAPILLASGVAPALVLPAAAAATASAMAAAAAGCALHALATVSAERRRHTCAALSRFVDELIARYLASKLRETELDLESSLFDLIEKSDAKLPEHLVDDAWALVPQPERPPPWGSASEATVLRSSRAQFARKVAAELALCTAAIRDGAIAFPLAEANVDDELARMAAAVARSAFDAYAYQGRLRPVLRSPSAGPRLQASLLEAERAVVSGLRGLGARAPLPPQVDASATSLVVRADTFARLRADVCESTLSGCLFLITRLLRAGTRLLQRLRRANDGLSGIQRALQAGHRALAGLLGRSVQPSAVASRPVVE